MTDQTGLSRSAAEGVVDAAFKTVGEALANDQSLLVKPGSKGTIVNPMCVGWGASTPYKEIARMEIEQKHAVKLEIPKIEKSNLSRAVDYYRKISYHRGLVLEGIRLCAMRNRGFWHGIYEELLQEKRRPVKREVVEERIRNIQKERGEAAYQQVLREYNNQRIEAGLDPAKDGGPFWVAHEVKSSMEQRLVVPITFFSWEIYMCLLYVEIEAYRSHTQGFQS